MMNLVNWFFYFFGPVGSWLVLAMILLGAYGLYVWHQEKRAQRRVGAKVRLMQEISQTRREHRQAKIQQMGKILRTRAENLQKEKTKGFKPPTHLEKMSEGFGPRDWKINLK